MNNIYSFLKEQFNIQIQGYNFERDYILKPLIPHKDMDISNNDLTYMYIDLGLSTRDIGKILQLDKKTVSKYLKKYDIRKSYNVIQRIKTEKAKQTKLLKYGDENFNNRNKFNESCLQKYGVKNPFQSEEIKNKIKENILNIYDTDNYAKTEEFKRKVQKTCLKKYDNEYYLQSQEYNNRMSLIDRKEITLKALKTKKKTRTINSSKIEEEIYKLLCEKYNEVNRQYISEEYPFPCDFYIPSIDTYIEYQGFWTHGKEPYIGSEEQKNVLNLWKNKNSTQYKRAIKTWTIEDIKKREIAIQNNLNWLEFFNMNQFMYWFNNS